MSVHVASLLILSLFQTEACPVRPTPDNKSAPVQEATVLTRKYREAKTALGRVCAIQKQQPANYTAIDRALVELGNALRNLEKANLAASSVKPPGQPPDKAARPDQGVGVLPPPILPGKEKPVGQEEKKTGQTATEEKYLKKPVENPSEMPITDVPFEKRKEAVQKALQVYDKTLQAAKLKEKPEGLSASLRELTLILEGLTLRKGQNK